MGDRRNALRLRQPRSQDPHQLRRQLRSGGVQIQSVGLTVRGSTTVVVVGVTGLTDAIRAELAGRYGDTIVVEEQAPIAPA